MTPILQASLPPEMRGVPGLPGVAPCAPDDWLRVDDAYADQMALRETLLAAHRETVLYLQADARPAARELLAEVLEALGWPIGGSGVTCPDGRKVPVDAADPMGTLGRLVQQDLCILQKRGDEHVLTGAVLCFPASWRLADKAGRPLTGIHEPVPEYDEGIARRVQRLFDGVQAGRPLWRFNRLSYAAPDLHQPRRIGGDAPRDYVRSERQCILRLPRSQAVVFSIHTYVVRAPVS